MQPPTLRLVPLIHRRRPGDRVGPKGGQTISERTVASNEEPFEDPGADDEPDSPEGAELSDNDLVDDTAVEEMSVLVPDADRVEGGRDFGWANEPLLPIAFPDIDPKADL